MHVGILPICVSEYAKEVYGAFRSPETRKSLSYLRKNRRECRFAAIFALLESGLALVIPPVFASIIDVGITEMNARRILLCGLTLIAVGAARLCCAVTARRFAARASACFAARLRRAVSVRVRPSDSAGDGVRFPALSACMENDIERLQNGVGDALARLSGTPLIWTAALIAAFRFDGGCGCVFSTAVLALTCVGAGSILMRIPLSRCVRERRDAPPRDRDDRMRAMEAARLQSLCDRVRRMPAALCFSVFGAAAAALLFRCAQIKPTRGQITALLIYLAMCAAACAKSAERVCAAAEAGFCGYRIGDLLIFGLGKPMRNAVECPSFPSKEEASA